MPDEVDQPSAVKVAPGGLSRGGRSKDQMKKDTDEVGTKYGSDVLPLACWYRRDDVGFGRKVEPVR